MYLYVLFTEGMSTDIITTCGTYGWDEKSIRGFVTKPEGKRPIEIHKRIWDNNIKIDLKGGRGLD